MPETKHESGLMLRGIRHQPHTFATRKKRVSDKRHANGHACFDKRNDGNFPALLSWY